MSEIFSNIASPLWRSSVINTLMSELGFSWKRLSGIQLLIALIVLLVSFPFIETLRAGTLIKSILLTAVLTSAVVAIAEERRTLIVAIALAVPAVAARWINEYRPDLMAPEVFLVAAILFIIFVIGNLLRFILKAKWINTSVLCSAISSFLLLGILWTFAYWLVADRSPRNDRRRGSSR